MADVHDRIEEVLRSHGFRDMRKPFRKKFAKFDWVKTDKHGNVYGVNFEMYAYVLYKRVKLYTTTSVVIGWILKLFLKQKNLNYLEFGSDYSLCITDFRTPKKADEMIKLLLQDEVEEIEESYG
jgi:hypothetical protein